MRYVVLASLCLATVIAYLQRAALGVPSKAIEGELGLGPKDQILLALTLVVGIITLGTGRTTVLQGIVHLVVFAVFLFFAVVP